jgi:hypothetical protein
MRFESPGGNSVTLTVLGYQFPDADHPAKRFSWHVVTGEATDDSGTWSFECPALTCDETPKVSRWLRDVADWLDGLGPSHRQPPLRR